MSSNVRWAMDGDFAILALLAPQSTDGDTPIESDPIDLRDYPGRRIRFLLRAAGVDAYTVEGPLGDPASIYTPDSAFEGEITFAVEDAEDDGTGEPDTWAAATTHGSLALLDAAGSRDVAMLTKKDRPFVRVTAVGDDGSALARVSALALLFHNP